jgi:membrane-associated phospholipid phosphatase
MQLFWHVITLIGSPELWLLLGVAPLGYLTIKNLRHEAKTLRHFQLVLFALSVLTVIALTIILKLAIAVPRPCTPCLSPEISACNPYCPSGFFDTYSFPSGHAASAFAGFTALFLVGRKRLYLALFFLPALVALSRFYLGVHTLTDILAGAILGIAIPIILDVFLVKITHPARRLI